MKVLVTGAGGFIGWHLANRLHDEGNDVYCIDIKLPQFAPCKAKHFQLMDLRLQGHVAQYFIDNGPFDEVYALAADMGGIGFIENYRAQIMRNNILINCHTLHHAYMTKAKRYLFTSSACVYPIQLQNRRLENNDTLYKNFPKSYMLKESDAYPAMAEEGYGWEKLYTEMMCQWYRREYGFYTRIARLHNIYGPYGAYEGGREKAPAAICRKVINADLAIEIWGDGSQIRTFCYIDDAVEGLIRIMRCNYKNPINLGSDKAMTIDGLVNVITTIAGKDLLRTYSLNRPQGVFARSSDNTLIKKVLGWEPQISYVEGLKKTYEWIEGQIKLKEQLK